MFDNLSAEQLRDEYATYARAEQATTDAPPLPENAPGNLTPAQQQILAAAQRLTGAANIPDHIPVLFRQAPGGPPTAASAPAATPQTWTAREREDVRLAARAAMRTL